jgi:hypothetical protein
MLYEMLTGEKPFPGQSITTVIYKIVNEDPVAPRQLNPSIHPGLNSIAMRALAKEPEVRYQTCREMIEDLRNYRGLGGTEQNPDATMISPRAGSPMALASASPGLRGLHGDPSSSPALRSLQSHRGNPSQTPVIRRTGAIQTFEEPKKSSPLGTIFAALLLLSVIVYGGYKLRPEFQATRERNKTYEALKSEQPAQPVVPTAIQPSTISIPVTEQPAANDATSPAAAAVMANSPASTPTPAGNTPTSASAQPPATSAPEKKPEIPASTVPAANKVPALSVVATEYKGRFEEAVAEKGLGTRVKISGTGNSLTISGKLRPVEHAALLRLIRNAPASVRVVDDIQYEDAPASAALSMPAQPQPAVQSAPRPATSSVNSAVNVITDAPGAMVTIFGPAGRAISSCQAPCTFNDLIPARYSLQVQRSGYVPVQTAVELKPHESLDQRIHLDALAKGLYVSSRPAGAEVFINGAKQSGQTPTTLPLAPGQYDLVLRIPGYEAYAGHVQVKDNIQTTLDVELKEKTQVHVAWAQVDSTPSGAEIFVDGAPANQTTPARVQIPVGSHIIAIRMAGYQVAKRGVQASEGGTVNITEVLRPLRQ